MDSQEKNKFKEKWGDNVAKEINYFARLEQGLYDDGVAIICGQLRRGPHAGYYIICLDFDRKEAFDKFCEILGTTLDNLAKWTRVEWHESLERIHVFLISKKPFKNLAAGGLEVKAGNPGRLLAIVSPSMHKSGNPYTAYHSESIAVLDGIDQMKIERVIEMFVTSRTDNTRSYFNDDEKEEWLKYLELETTILRVGERNPATLRKACSYFFKHTGEFKDLSDEQKYWKLVTWHNKHCEPPLFQVCGREDEVKDIWNRVCRKFTGERGFRRDKREEEEERLKDEVKKNAPNIGEKKQDIVAGLDQNIRNARSENIWTMISETPKKFIVGRMKKADICRSTVSASEVTTGYGDSAVNEKVYYLNYGSIIFKVFPIQVTLHENPLKFLESPLLYTIVFEDQNGKHFTLTGSIMSIVESLKERPGAVVSTYGAVEPLTAICGAFEDDGRLIVDSSVSFEGYYFHDGDIKISKINFDEKHPIRTIEEILQCIDYLEKRAQYQIWYYKGKTIDRRDLLASAIQLTIAAPFNFAIKQITRKYWQKAFDMTVERDGGKSGLSQEMLNIHGNHSQQKDVDSKYSVAAGSMNTEAKFGKGVSKTTYPIEISEFGSVELYGRNENLVEIIKTAIDGLIVRRGRDANRYDSPFPSCSPFILNGNPFITKKGEILKRFHVAKFTEEDRHDRDPKSDFNVFQSANSHKIKIIGDWTIRYILDNRDELLLSGKYTVYDIAKKAIHEFYKFVGKEVPEWITTWIVDMALEELDVDDESVIRSILFDHVYKTLERSGRLADLGNRETDVGNDGKIYLTGKINPTTLAHKIETCINNELWSWLRRKNLKLGEWLQEYYIDTSILELFSKRLPQLDLKKLAEKTGFTYSQRKGGMRVLKCAKHELIDFIQGKDIPEEEDSKVGTSHGNLTGEGQKT